MIERDKLRAAMEKLIKTIETNKQSQQEVFGTLTAADFQKMLGYLQDQDPVFRKATLVLLTRLLHDNRALQLRFCEMMDVNCTPGKIVLTSRFPPRFSHNREALMEVIRLLKTPVSTNSTRALYWFINFNCLIMDIQYVDREGPIIDPIDCIVGINLQQQHPTNRNSFKFPHPKLHITHHLGHNSNSKPVSQSFRANNTPINHFIDHQSASNHSITVKQDLIPGIPTTHTNHSIDSFISTDKQIHSNQKTPRKLPVPAYSGPSKNYISTAPTTTVRFHRDSFPIIKEFGYMLKDHYRNGDQFFGR